MRHGVIILALSALAVALDHRGVAREPSNGQANEANNVILVVSDGLRWQEVFRGADSAILFGDPRMLGSDAAGLRRTYWRATIEERRRALMPFLWGTLAKRGEHDGIQAARSRRT